MRPTTTHVSRHHLSISPGEKEKALVALEEAVRRGWSDSKHTAEDEDLAALREEPGFQRILAVMRGDVPRRHVRIDSIVADSPAAKAGLHDADVLVTITGKMVETLDEVKAEIQGGASVAGSVDPSAWPPVLEWKE